MNTGATPSLAQLSNLNSVPAAIQSEATEAAFVTVQDLLLPGRRNTPWNLRSLRYISVIVHPVCALLTIGLFIIHVYMGTAMERGAFGSVIRGDVSSGWAKRFHRIWYERLFQEAPAKK